MKGCHFFGYPRTASGIVFLLSFVSSILAGSRRCLAQLAAPLPSSTVRFAWGGWLFALLFLLVLGLALWICLRKQRQAEQRMQTLETLNARLKQRVAESQQHEHALREHLEGSLAEEHRLLRTVIDNLPDYIFVKDAAGRFVLNNAAHVRLLGATSADEVVGKTDFDFFPQEIAARYQAAEQKVLQAGRQVVDQEEWTIEPESRKRWLLHTKFPLPDQHGKITRLVGISRDHTDRKLEEEAYQQHTRELNLLNHMGNLLQACHTEEETYNVMNSICKLLFPSDSGYLSLLDEQRQTLHVVMSWGYPPPATQTFGVNDCWALRLDTTHVVNHPESGGLLCTHLGSYPENGYLCSPVSSTAGDVLGVFCLRFGVFNPAYSAEERTRQKEARRMVVNRVIRHYALFTINLRLRETLRVESIRDPLTGLYNRRHMEASLEREAHRAERLHTPVGLIMLDVDHFKTFNDRYGHELGDTVLRELGELLQSRVRAEDIACRYGGEEFLLILPEASLEVVRQRAEEIRMLVKSLRIPYQSQILHITISAGVAVFPQHAPDVTSAVRAADTALYQAKTSGRDQVVMTSAGMPTSPRTTLSEAS